MSQQRLFLTFPIWFCYTWSCLVETCIFEMCFCYWSNSFMKGDKGGYFSKFPDWKPLLLFKIKTKQSPGCPNKESNVDFKRFRAYHRGKKICIDQWLVKCCILGRTWAELGVGEQIWFYQVEELGGVATPEKFCRCWGKLWKQYFQHFNWKNIDIWM